MMAFERRTASSSPVDKPLRRLPGQSVREERERVFDDHAMGYLLAIGVVWILAIWEWIHVWIGGKPNPAFTTLVAALVSMYCAYRLWRLFPQFRNLNLAEKGERRVSEV